MLSRTLKMTCWICYDHLGKLLLLNVLSILLLTIPVAFGLGVWALAPSLVGFILGAGATIVGLIVLLALLSLGYGAMVVQCLEQGETCLETFFQAIKRSWRGVLPIALIYSFSACLLVISMLFYATKLPAPFQLLGYVLSASALWALFFLLATSFYVIPALLYKRGGAWRSMKLAGMIVLDNPLFSLFLGLLLLVLLATALAPPLLLLFSIAPALVLLGVSYEMLARQYQALEKGYSRAQIREKAGEVFQDAQDDYLNRGFRDFLFPWLG